MSETREKKVKIRTVITAFSIILVLYTIATGIAVCYFPLTGNFVKNRLVKKTTEIIPYPAAIVDSEFVSVDKLSDQLEGVRKFYESQDFSELGLRVDFSTEDGAKRLKIKEKNILNKLIDDSIIESEAKKRGIKITSEIVDQEVDRKLKEYGTGQQLKENLSKLYGWELENFKEYIVKPDLYRERLAVDIKKDNQSFVTAKEKIEKAGKDLESGKVFSEVAKEYSEGATAEEGGDLGWFSANQMIPEVAEEVFVLEKGGRSGIIESSIGYHIVELEDKKTENEQELVKLKQIFVRTQSFSEWLLETKKGYRIYIPLAEFFWKGEKGEAEFKDGNMKKYEEQLLNNPINDPSVIF